MRQEPDSRGQINKSDDAIMWLYTSCKPHKNLRWISAKSQIHLRDTILAFKSMTGQVPNYLSSKFISRGNISSRATRSSTQLNILLFKTKLRQRSSYYRTVTLWHALKPHFKLSESVVILKYKMKAFLFNQFLIS